MIEWITAETTAPNFIWLIVSFVGGFGLLATIQSTERLKRSTKNWNDISRMVSDLTEQLEEEKRNDRS